MIKGDTIFSTYLIATMFLTVAFAVAFSVTDAQQCPNYTEIPVSNVLSGLRQYSRVVATSDTFELQCKQYNFNATTYPCQEVLRGNFRIRINDNKSKSVVN